MPSSNYSPLPRLTLLPRARLAKDIDHLKDCFYRAPDLLSRSLVALELEDLNPDPGTFTILGLVRNGNL